MHKSIYRFTDFMSWIFKQYREIMEYTARNFPFRIVDAQRSAKTGETTFTIQFVGKSTVFKMSADALAEDDDLIQGFSARDVKRIIKANLIKPKLTLVHGGAQQTPYKIIAKNFERQPTKPSYVIEQIVENHTITKTVHLDEMTQSKEILLKFSKQDIFEIAYTAGANSILQAKDEITQKKDLPQ